MAIKDAEKFEVFLWESFKDGLSVRELRLSDDEREYLENKYPKACIKKIETAGCQDRKAWYEVRL